MTRHRRRLAFIVSAAAAAALAVIAPTVSRAATVITSPFRGVTHYHRVEPAGAVVPRQVVMDIVQIDRAASGIGFLTTPGNGAAPGEFTAQTTSQFVQQHNLQIGLNGDFFSTAGTGPNGEIYRDVTNLAASNGSLISAWPASPGTIRGALNVSASNVPTLVRPASSSGGTYNTVPTITPYNTIGGSDRMIDNGNIILTSAFALEVHPRTVIGYNATHLFLFTVDGRQEGYSMGMNLHEIANVLKNDYGVTYALNLDGGGSTTMVMADPNVRVVNRPSDKFPDGTFGKERLNGNNFGVFASHWPQWNVNAGGNWSLASNWSAGVPNAPGAAVKFGKVITTPRTITVNVAATAGTVLFENANAYTLAGSQPITLDSTAGNAIVRAYVGSHNINAPLTLADHVDIDVVEAGRTLAIGSGISNGAGRTINKLGAGGMAISGAQTHAIGAVLNVNGGVLSMMSNAGSAAAANLSVNVNGSAASFGAKQNLSALTINATGNVLVATGGGKTIKTRSLGIAAGGGKLDLTDNNLVIDYTGGSPLGSASAGVYSGVTRMIQTGYADGAWTGPGIHSTRAASAASPTALAVSEAAEVLGLSGTQTATWSGQTVDATSILVMYTYDGDANLDGQIDAGDYGILDYFVQLPGASGYAHGDFNYDGFIDAADYGTLDNSIQFQGPPLPAAGAASSASASASATAVPEPSLAALALLALAASRARCRR